MRDRKLNLFERLKRQYIAFDIYFREEKKLFISTSHFPLPEILFILNTYFSDILPSRRSFYF